jgi:hypothetical protein
MARPRLQFRLSTFLWLTLAVACFCGGMAVERWLKPKNAVEPIRHPPCHPGCFPAGTLIDVPNGSKPIERVRIGERITTIGSGGDRSEAEVTAVFATENRLFEVNTDMGKLLTTETQPLALVGGTLREAGKLRAGDRIFRWEPDGRHEATVRAVTATGREATVFNLVLAQPAVFVANGFLARSKPPGPQSDSAAIPR